MMTRSMKRRFRKILLACTLALLEGFTAVGGGPRPVFGQGDVLADGAPIEASRVMGEATRQEHLYGQDFDSAKLRDAIKGYTRLVRERPNSIEAYQAAERLKALRISVPEPDTSYSIVEQNKALDIAARQKFIDDTLVGLTRRLVQQGLSIEDAVSQMLANAVERLSQLRRPGICVMPGCTNPVPGRKLCPAHITEITTYVENVAKQIKTTDQQVEQYIVSIRQVNTVEAYDTLVNYLRTVNITDSLRSRSDGIILDGKASVERSDTAKLHLKFKLPTGKDADRLAKKYAEVVAQQRADIDETYSNYYIDGQQYPVDRDRLKREYTDAVERLSIRDQNSSSKFRKCPVPWCTATTKWGRGSSASGAVCQAHLDEINAIIDERAAYYKARSIKTTVSAPTIDVSFRILYCNGFALLKDLCAGQGSTVQQAIDNAMVGIKDVDGDDLEPACNIAIAFKVSGSNNGAIIKLSGDATSKTLYKAVEEATTKARQLNDRERAHYNQESLNWLLANWGTKKVIPLAPKMKAVANDEVTVSAPILQEPDAAQPLTVVASDVRALSKRVFALCKELSDLGAINGLKFNTRFAEVQAELRTLNGIQVTWPATVTRISDDSDYEPGVHVKTVIPWAPGGCGLIGFYVHFVPADVHGDEYLSYGVHISKRYAASLKVGDIIRIHGVIDKSLLENSNNYSHRLQGFGYNIGLTESRAVEPATITAATVRADSEVDKLKAIDEIRAKLQAISVQSPRWSGDLLDQESNALINFVDPSNWRSYYIHTLYAWVGEYDRSQDTSKNHWQIQMIGDYVLLHYHMHHNDIITNHIDAAMVMITERIRSLRIRYADVDCNQVMTYVQGSTSRWDADSDKPRVIDDLKPIISKVCEGSTVDLESHGSESLHTMSRHEARKARSAYLIERITMLGNEIDKMAANGQNPRHYWRAIIDNQDELLNIYRIELNGNTDPDCVRILRSNIAKLTRGREFAWDAIKNCR